MAENSREHKAKFYESHSRHPWKVYCWSLSCGSNQFSKQCSWTCGLWQPGLTSREKSAYRCPTGLGWIKMGGWVRAALDTKSKERWDIKIELKKKKNGVASRSEERTDKQYWNKNQQTHRAGKGGKVEMRLRGMIIKHWTEQGGIN